jgi:type IV secretion system protein VirD4
LAIFIVGGLFVATQYVAYQLNFAAFLGKPAAKILVPIYNPINLLVWTIKYYSKYPACFDVAVYISLFGMITGFAAMALVSIVILRHGKTTDTHGTARWASKREVKKMGFGNKGGVVLGKLPGLGILTHHGPEHIFLSAPTRSGKGVSFIIPTLFSWGESVVVLDLKKENWAISAGFRSKFSHVICFDPTSTDGACWNPLLEVRKGKHELQDTQNIVDILIDPNGNKKNLNHWDNTAHSLLVAAILHVLYVEQDKSLSGVANFLSNPKRGILDTLNHMKNTPHIDGTPHSIVASIAQEMLNKSADELSGVISTAATSLKLYRDPLIARNTAKSDFAINDLMNAKYPVSLYLVVPAGDIARVTSLNRLMINMICRKLTGVTIGKNGSPWSCPLKTIPLLFLIMPHKFSRRQHF